MDELAFEVGELIQVIEYDDPEEQVGVLFLVELRRLYVKYSRRKAG